MGKYPIYAKVPEEPEEGLDAVPLPVPLGASLVSGRNFWKKGPEPPVNPGSEKELSQSEEVA